MSKKEKILEAALDLFYRHGFHGTSTSMIIEEAGVAKGTLFYYFHTKDEMVLTLYRHVREQLYANLSRSFSEGNSPAKQLDMLYKNYIGWALAHAKQHHFIQQFYFSSYITRYKARGASLPEPLHLELLEMMAASGMLKDMPIELMSRLLTSQINGVYSFLKEAGPTLPEQEKIIQQGYELLWQMLKK